MYSARVSRWRAGFGPSVRSNDDGKGNIASKKSCSVNHVCRGWDQQHDSEAHQTHVTQRHTDTETYRHRHTQTQTHTDTDTYRHRDIQTQRHTDTDTHRHRHIQTQTHTDTETYRHRDIQTHRETESGECVFECLSVCVCYTT